jgi:hypothetical protein
MQGLASMLGRERQKLLQMFSRLRIKIESEESMFEGTEWDHTEESQKGLEERFNSYNYTAMQGLELLANLLQEKEEKYRVQLDLIAEDYKDALEGYKLDLAKHRQGMLDLETTIYQLTERNKTLGTKCVNKKTMRKLRDRSTRKTFWR